NPHPVSGRSWGLAPRMPPAHRAAPGDHEKVGTRDSMTSAIGMIFQEFGLAEPLTVMGNVLSGRLGYVGCRGLAGQHLQSRRARGIGPGPCAVAWQLRTPAGALVLCCTFYTASSRACSGLSYMSVRYGRPTPRRVDMPRSSVCTRGNSSTDIYPCCIPLWP